MRRQRGRVIHHPLRPETRTENAQSTTNVTSNSLSTALFSNLDQVQIASQLPSHRTESWYRTIEKKSHPPCTYLTSFFPGICRLACVRPVPWPQATPLRDGHPESTASTITPLPDVDAVLSSLKLLYAHEDKVDCVNPLSANTAAPFRIVGPLLLSTVGKARDFPDSHMAQPLLMVAFRRPITLLKSLSRAG
ncbi:hypothetical protein CC2G_001422 [Coprinopsis cinerea AmutBmut pab1-1]|nr:hypothetical protein CC2G_001422 [Coprinopsis cinerea AmutBmut pab1-1]